MSFISLILLNFCLNIVLSRAQICSTDDTLQMMAADKSVIFKVDRQTKNTTVTNLIANTCECNGNDVSKKFELLEARLATLELELANLKNNSSSSSLSIRVRIVSQVVICT
jgi:hypothetical protein